MEKFFHDLLVEEGAVYTLWGSKPITEIVLYHLSEEEMQAVLRDLPKSDLENCYVSDNYDLPQNWEKWEKIHSRFQMNRYLLFRSHFTEDGKMSFVYFVDILKTASLIKDSYDLFRKAVGFDFHPLEAVLEMPNSNSRFWKKVRKAEERSVLWGLLFGYGKVNSYTFHWKYFDCPDTCTNFTKSLASRFSNPPPKGRVRTSLKDFTIPPFASFDKEDEMIVRYKREREEIQAAYKNKNFLELTLQKLTES